MCLLLFTATTVMKLWLKGKGMNNAKISVLSVVFFSVIAHGAQTTPPAISRSVPVTPAKKESPGRILYRLIADRKDDDALKLLQSGTIDLAAVNERLEEFPHTPTALHRALSRKASPVPLVRALLNAQADVHADGHDGLPLMLATALGDKGKVRLLVEEGKANPNQVSQLHYSSTALHTAALAGSQGIASYLVEKGARADIRDSAGMTPEEWAFAQTGAPLPLPLEDQQG